MIEGWIHFVYINNLFFLIWNMIEKCLLLQLNNQKRLFQKQKKNFPIFQKKIDEYLRIELTYNSMAIEWSSLTREDVAKIINADKAKLMLRLQKSQKLSLEELKKLLK